MQLEIKRPIVHKLSHLHIVADCTICKKYVFHLLQAQSEYDEGRREQAGKQN
jgi:hypothetical protein